MKKNKYNYFQIRQMILNDCSDLLYFQISPEQNLVEVMDSLDQVGVIMKIEERFDICIKDVDAEKFFDKKHVTVDDLINELEKYGIINLKQERKQKLENMFKKPRKYKNKL